VIGLGAKPLAGACGMVSSTFDSVSSPTASPSRVRPPRNLQAGGQVTDYSRQDAEGWNLLCQIEGGKYKSETYLCHLHGSIGPARNILLITEEHAFYLKYQSPTTVLWFIALKNLISCGIADQGVIIHVNRPPSLFDFSGAVATKKVVYCDSADMAQEVKRRIDQTTEIRSEKISLRNQQ